MRSAPWYIYRLRRKSRNTLAALLNFHFCRRTSLRAQLISFVNYFYYNCFMPAGARARRYGAISLRRIEHFNPSIYYCTALLLKKFGLKKSPVVGKSRYFLKSSITPNEFFEALNKDGIYVVLRWHQLLTDEWASGRDVDILIDNGSIELITSLCTKVPNRYAIDIYSAGYDERFLRGDCTCFPEHVSNNILRDRKRNSDNICVPSDRDMVLSFAYHLVLHKGIDAGFTTTEACSDFKKGYFNELIRVHNIYPGILKEDENGFIDMSALGIFDVLRCEGWLPSISTIRSIALTNTLLRDCLNSRSISNDIFTKIGETDLMAFIIRDRVSTVDSIQKIVEHLKKKQLQVIKSNKKDECLLPLAKRENSSGNWRRGQYQMSGGLPWWIICCLDYNPEPVSEGELVEFPFVRNKRVRIKESLRSLVNYNTFFFEHSNSIHSSDDEEEAFEYIDICLTRTEKSYLLRDLRDYRRLYQEHPKGLFAFKGCGRSKIFVLAHRDGLRVRKVFRPDKMEYFKNELTIYTKYSHMSFVPKLLGHGENYIDIEFLDICNKGNEVIDSQSLRKIVLSILDEAYVNRIALIDFRPSNLVFNSNGVPFMIDYEFSYEYSSDYPEGGVTNGFDIAGLPKGFRGVYPGGLTKSGRNWNNTWLQLCGPI